jgi:hypothetical protein
LNNTNALVTSTNAIINNNNNSSNNINNNNTNNTSQFNVINKSPLTQLPLNSSLSVPLGDSSSSSSNSGGSQLQSSSIHYTSSGGGGSGSHLNRPPTTSTNQNNSSSSLQQFAATVANNSPATPNTSTSFMNETAQSSSASQLQFNHGHFFIKKTFHKPTYCHHCTEMLWGLIGQGFVCEGKKQKQICQKNFMALKSIFF